MELLYKLENTMAGWFKGAPKLSESTKETLVKIWPWLALIGGVLSALSALTLLNWARSSSELVEFANELSRVYGTGETVSRFTIWVWVALIVVAIEAVLLLIAYPKLKRREKSGWDLLFLVAVLNVVYGIVSVFTDYYGSIGSLIFSLLISAVIFWLLFATRDKYKGAKVAPAAPEHKAE